MTFDLGRGWHQKLAVHEYIGVGFRDRTQSSVAPDLDRGRRQRLAVHERIGIDFRGLHTRPSPEAYTQGNREHRWPVLPHGQPLAQRWDQIVDRSRKLVDRGIGLLVLQFGWN